MIPARRLFALCCLTSMVLLGCPKYSFVPLVEGLAKQDAITAITGALLIVGTETEEVSATFAKGRVLRQDPAPGSRVVLGSMVNLVYSKGPIDDVTVPDVSGMTQDLAAATLTTARLQVNVTMETSDTTVGLVIRQTPAKDTIVIANATVTIVVSSGPDPTKVNAPDLTGLTTAAAETSLTNVGLKLGATTQETSNTVAVGLIIRQTPVAGTSVSLNSAINIVVSTGPATTIVPDILGLTQDAATTALTSATLTLGTVTEEFSDTIEVGKVMTQTPDAGTQVLLNSTVNIVISKGPDPSLKVIVSDVTTAPTKEADARTTLEAAGFVVCVQYESSTQVKIGEVARQQPAAGTEVAAHSIVFIWVSSGVQVPNVHGLMEDFANTALAGLDIKNPILSLGSAPFVPVGEVIGQSLAPFSYVELNTAITLTLSAVAAPLINGLAEADALADLTALTLPVFPTPTDVFAANGQTAGTVVNQNPVAGVSCTKITYARLKGVAPNLVGKTLIAAGAILTPDGLGVNFPYETVYEVSAVVPFNNVIRQDPVFGTLCTNITLYVSGVAVPSVTALNQTADLAAAQALITGAGFGLNSTRGDRLPVISTTPTGVTFAGNGVDLVASVKLPTVVELNALGLANQQAIVDYLEEITTLGFLVTVVPGTGTATVTGIASTPVAVSGVVPYQAAVSVTFQ